MLPISNANGCSASTRSASGSWAIRSVMSALVGLHGEHRPGRVEEDPLGVAAEDQLAHRRAAPPPDDDDLSVDLLGHVHQVVGGVHPPDQLPRLVLAPPRPELLADLLELLLRLDGVLAVELTATAVRVHHHEPGVLQLP